MDSNERTLKFIQDLPQDEDEQAEAIHKLVKDSVDDECKLDTAIGLYHLAARGLWSNGSIAITQCLLTAVADNPRLLPLVEGNIELMVQRLDQLGARFRRTWEFISSELHHRQ
jgi:hypothetical protein